MFCRTMFCEACFKKSRPQENQFFVLYGKDHQTFYKHRVDKFVHAKEYGFTPHLITVLGHENGLVHLEVICAMQNCGVHFGERLNDKEQQIVLLGQRKITLSEKDFKALYEFKDNGYEI